MQVQEIAHAEAAPAADPKRFWRRRIFRVASVAGLAIALALGLVQTMKADDDDRTGEASGGGGRCSNRSLRGDYGFTIDGTIFAGPNTLLLRGVAMTRFDGRGNSSQVDFTTRNGVPASADWRPATGSYEINPDCTGTATFNFDDGSPSLHLRLVVVDRGRQVLTSVETAGTGSIGIRVR